MTKKEQKLEAQRLIMYQLGTICYGYDYEEFCKNFDSEEEACACLKKQMDRVAKMFNYKESWFF